jgi:hypothetical protein
VETALREASQRGEKCIFEPKIAKVFQSIEEAFEFFNMYSWEAGFGIRHGRSRINAGGEKTRQDIVCSCQVSVSTYRIKLSCIFVIDYFWSHLRN